MNCCKQSSNGECCAEKNDATAGTCGSPETICCGGGCGNSEQSCCMNNQPLCASEKMCCGTGCSDCVYLPFSADAIYSRGLDVGKLVLLSTLSSAMYQNYWLYRNWKHIKEYKQLSIRPVLRTVLAFLPIVDIVFFCLQFKYIHTLAREEKRKTFPLVWTCIGYSFFIVLSWLFFGAEFISASDPQLTFALFFFQLLAIVFMSLILVPVQLSLNDIWLNADKGKSLRTSYTNGEIAWLVIGSIIMLFSLYSIYSAPPAPLDNYNLTPPLERQQNATPQDNSQG